MATVEPDSTSDNGFPRPVEVEVWLIPASALQGTLERGKFVCSDEERERAGRFRFAVDRQSFLAGRMALRTILARKLGLAPERLGLRLGRRGGPRLASPNPRGYRFSLSHSGELIAIALTRRHQVGVDLEDLRNVERNARAAERILSAREAALLGVPSVSRLGACWTAKEAVIKGLGKGLHLAPMLVELEFSGRRPSSVLSLLRHSPPEPGWTIATFAPKPGYVGAVAVHARRCQVLLREIRDADELVGGEITHSARSFHQRGIDGEPGLSL